MESETRKEVGGQIAKKIKERRKQDNRGRAEDREQTRREGTKRQRVLLRVGLRDKCQGQGGKRGRERRDCHA